MPRAIILDTFPLSNAARQAPEEGRKATLGQKCYAWLSSCLAAGNPVVAPAICYYEAPRELERLGAPSQIARLRQFCFSSNAQFLSITDAHLEEAAKLWAQARRNGIPTASPDALDGDVILAAQALSLGLAPAALVVATTNTAHLSRFVTAEPWDQIAPGS